MTRFLVSLSLLVVAILAVATALLYEPKIPDLAEALTNLLIFYTGIALAVIAMIVATVGTQRNPTKRYLIWLAFACALVTLAMLLAIPLIERA